MFVVFFCFLRCEIRVPLSLNLSFHSDQEPKLNKAVQEARWPFRLTFPVMTMQPSWSMMRTSSWDGGWQNFCCKICRMCSITLGVSLSATAMWPSVRMVWSGMRWASLAWRKEVFKGVHSLFVEVERHHMTQRCYSLVILLWNVQSIRQTSEKGLHDHVIHGQTSFQTSGRTKNKHQCF